MDELFTRYGLNPTEFMRVLTKSKSFIAGGSACYIFCGGDPAKFNGDIDIWIPNCPRRRDYEEAEHDREKRKQVALHRHKIDILEGYIQSCGYQPKYATDKGFQEEYLNPEHSLFKKIVAVTTLEFMDKRIQIISSPETPEGILNSFDYSFCAVGYTADGSFFGKELVLTTEKKGYVMNPSRSVERNQMRRKKYEERGFTIVEI